jgi:hypothetical protein
VKFVVVQFAPLPIVYGAPAPPNIGGARFENEMLGARSKLTPTSPRTYQFEPDSKISGLEGAGRVGGGAVPKRSAAEAGAATIAAAQARDMRTFIGHPRIATSARDTATLSRYSGDQDLILV